MKSIILVDAHNILHRCYHACENNPLMTSTGIHTSAIYGLWTHLLRLNKEYPGTALVAVFDPIDGSAWRKALYPEYKAGRKEKPPELPPQIEASRELVHEMGFEVVCCPGYEADDAIASLARSSEAKGYLVLIVSSDKDLRQLVSDRVRVLTPSGVMYSEAEVLVKHEVPPSLLGDLLALAGDASDNVPGVDGIGGKTAAALLNTYGSLAQVLAAAPTIKGKRGATLVAQADRAWLSRKLVDLRLDAPVPDPDTIAIRPISRKYLDLLDRYEFNSLTNEEEMVVLKGTPAVRYLSETEEQGART